MIAFRDAVPADIPAVHALIERAYRGDAARAGWTHEADLLGGQRTDPEALAAIIADPAQRLRLTDDGGALAGCVVVEKRAADLAYLGMLTVDPLRQANGLGHALLAEGERSAAEWGVAKIEMTAIRQRAELIAWYQRRGWRLTGETRPFPYGDRRFGEPRRDDLSFAVLVKPVPNRPAEELGPA